MRILLARHGETPWNAEGRYQGQIDIPLSPIGEAHPGPRRAPGLGGHHPCRRLAAVTRAAHRQLALGAARAGMLLTEPELQEIAHGEWEGAVGQ